MKCILCKTGETGAGTTTVTLDRGDSTLVFQHVPAQVCQTCGEAYIADDVSERIQQAAEAAVRDGVRVDVRTYRAA
jgi:YgiT-type zinc finger domain-containing protein